MTPSPASLPPQPSQDSSERPGHSDIRHFLADGAALGASAMFTALIGLFGWLLAARLLSPAEVGQANAYVSGFLLVAGFAELGLSQAVLRWLPDAGGLAGPLVLRLYAGIVLVCLVVGTAYAVAVEVDLPGPLNGFEVKALFVVSAAAWMIFHVQDFVLTGLGAARWVPLENITFGLVRVGLLLALAVPLGALGIVLSWSVSSVVWVIVVNLLLARAARRADRPPGVLPRLRDGVRTAGSVYVSTLGMTLLSYAVPIIVIARYGPAAGAVFSIVWLGLNALDFTAVGFGSALVVRLRGGSLGLLRAATTRVLPIFLAAIVVAALLAEPLLSLFGREYVDQGVALLRLVLLGVLFRVTFILVTAIHLARDRTPRMAVLHWLTALVLLAGVSLAPVDQGLSLLGWIYAGAQVLLAAVAVLDLARVARDEVEPLPLTG